MPRPRRARKPPGPAERSPPRPSQGEEKGRCSNASAWGRLHTKSFELSRATLGFASVVGCDVQHLRAYPVYPQRDTEKAEPFTCLVPAASAHAYPRRASEVSALLADCRLPWNNG